MRSLPLEAAVVAALLATAGCGSGIQERSRLDLNQFVQNGDDGVSLSEPLVFHFRQDLDRASVTSESVRIHEASRPDRRARGSFRIHRGNLEFLPDLPLSADLSDGGLLPGVEYVVELAGFPRVDGLRSTEGLQLVRTYRLPFRTARPPGRVLVGSPPQDYLHIDPGLRGAGSVVIGPLDPIVLFVGEAVDPTSLTVGEFEILTPENDVIALVPRLVENLREEARIELAPIGGSIGGVGLRALEEGTYYLRRAAPRTANLGGHVLPFGAPWRVGGFVQVEVRAPSIRTRVNTLSERPHYGDPRLTGEGGSVGSFAFDGTATWLGREGGVTLRYPAAAGDGHDGVLDPFLGLAGRTDVHAARLRIPEESEVDLGDAHGFVVLRSQGALEIEGKLKREIPGDWTHSVAAELARHENEDSSRWESLSAWLARSRDLNEPFTVLIAGGDIRVSGELEIEGPLLLVAGGWVRFEGRIRENELCRHCLELDLRQHGFVFKSREGGGNLGRVHNAPLALDPPKVNPLVLPLRVAVLTNAFRPQEGVDSWREGVPNIPENGGRAEVFFRGLRDRGDGVEPDLFSPVENLGLLNGCQAVQLLLVLEMPEGAGEPWRPPRIDSVTLSWVVGR